MDNQITIKELLEYTGFYYCHILIRKRFSKSSGFAYPLGGGYRDKIIERYGNMVIDTCFISDNALVIYVN